MLEDKKLALEKTREEIERKKEELLKNKNEQDRIIMEIGDSSGNEEKNHDASICSSIPNPLHGLTSET